MSARCKDCVFFREHPFQNRTTAYDAAGICVDRTKVIISRFGGAKTKPPEVVAYDGCMSHNPKLSDEGVDHEK